MTYESEELLAHGKILVNQSKRGTQKAKSWLLNCPTCSPPADGFAVTAVARRTNKLPLLQLSTNSRMQKILSRSKGMQTKSGIKIQLKCHAVCRDSKEECSETTTPHIGVRTRCKHSTLLDPCTITKDIFVGTKLKRRQMRGLTGRICRSRFPHRPKGEQSLYIRKLHLTSKWCIIQIDHVI